MLHAAWNALVKSSDDNTLSMGAVTMGHVPPALLALPFVPLPSSESLPYLFGGIALHFGYQMFLIQSYKAGDLTQVYPIARGSAPLVVALVSVVVLGVQLDGAELLAIVTIGAGILSLALVRQQDGLQNKNAALLALVTGLFIASYSFVDGLGARLAGSSLGFFCWLAIGNGILMFGFLAVKTPDTLRSIPTKGLPVLLIGGGA